MPKMNELFEKVAKDRDLQAKYVEIIQNSLESGEDATYKKLIDFAKDAGYDIAIDEMKEYFKGMTASKEGELPDSELDQVAGGFNGPGLPFPGGPGFPFPGGPRFPFPGDPGHIPMSIIFAGSNQCSRM
jgi:hypothetical protein